MSGSDLHFKDIQLSKSTTRSANFPLASMSPSVSSDSCSTSASDISGSSEGSLTFKGIRRGNRKMAGKKDVEVLVVCKVRHCSYTSDKASNLKRHVETMHETEKGTFCCKTWFMTQFDFDYHKATTHPTGFECEICHKKFGRKALLARHMCIHTGVKPFACSVCDYASANKGNVIRHLPTHAPDRAVMIQRPQPENYRPRRRRGNTRGIYYSIDYILNKAQPPPKTHEETEVQKIKEEEEDGRMETNENWINSTSTPSNSNWSHTSSPEPCNNHQPVSQHPLGFYGLPAHHWPQSFNNDHQGMYHHNSWGLINTSGNRNQSVPLVKGNLFCTNQSQELRLVQGEKILLESSQSNIEGDFSSKEDLEGRKVPSYNNFMNESPPPVQHRNLADVMDSCKVINENSLVNQSIDNNVFSYIPKKLRLSKRFRNGV